MKYMFDETKVGDVVSFDGHPLEVRSDGHCPQCFFNAGICSCPDIACASDERADGQNVYYKELKKKASKNGKD